MSRTAAEKVEIVWRWFRDNIFDRAACQPYLPSLPSRSCTPLHLILRSTHTLRVFSFNTWGLPIAPAALSASPICPLCSPPTTSSACRRSATTATSATSSTSQQRMASPTPTSSVRASASPCGMASPPPVCCCCQPLSPCVEVALKRFPVNGLLQRFDHSDWVAAKGVGLVRVDVSAIRSGSRSPLRPPLVVDVFLTHLHANYNSFYVHYSKCYTPRTQPTSSQPPPLPDFYLPHRVAQAFHLSRFIATHRQPHHLAVLCGDLNAPPYDIVLHLIQALTGLHDGYAEKGGSRPRLHMRRMGQPLLQVRRGSGQGRDGGRRPHPPLRAQPRRGDTVERSTRDHRDELHETPKRIDFCLFSLPTAPPPSPSPALPFLPASAPSPLFQSPFALTAVRSGQADDGVGREAVQPQRPSRVSATIHPLTLPLPPRSLGKATAAPLSHR